MDWFISFCGYVRLMPTIKESKSGAFYYVLYFCGVTVVLILYTFFGYITYCVSKRKAPVSWVKNFFKELILLTFCVLFNPFMEAFIGVFKCEDGYHSVATGLSCYGGLHIFLVVLGILFALLLFVIMFFFTIFNTEINPLPDYVFSKIDDNCELALVLYRVGVIIYCTFVSGVLLHHP